MFVYYVLLFVVVFFVACSCRCRFAFVVLFRLFVLCFLTRVLLFVLFLFLKFVLFVVVVVFCGSFLVHFCCFSFYQLLLFPVSVVLPFLSFFRFAIAAFCCTVAGFVLFLSLLCFIVGGCVCCRCCLFGCFSALSLL